MYTYLLVSFSAALVKTGKLTNNNVFHELLEQSLPPQVVFKPWLFNLILTNCQGLPWQVKWTHTMNLLELKIFDLAMMGAAAGWTIISNQFSFGCRIKQSSSAITSSLVPQLTGSQVGRGTWPVYHRLSSSPRFIFLSNGQWSTHRCGHTQNILVLFDFNLVIKLVINAVWK